MKLWEKVIEHRLKKRNKDHRESNLVFWQNSL